MKDNWEGTGQPESRNKKYYLIVTKENHIVHCYDTEIEAIEHIKCRPYLKYIEFDPNENAK